MSSKSKLSVSARLGDDNHPAELHVQQLLHGGHEPPAHPHHPHPGDFRVSLGFLQQARLKCFC